MALLATGLCTAVLAGCGTSSKPEPLKIGDAAHSSASSPSPARPTRSIQHPVKLLKSLPDGKVVVSRDAADGPEQRAAAQASIAYWTARMGALTKADPAYPGLSESARGQALSVVVDYVNQIRSQGLHQIGAGIFAVNHVRVRGSHAQVDGCLVNNGVNADKRGRPVESPKTFIATHDRLAHRAGTWMVTHTEVEAKRCRFR